MRALRNFAMLRLVLAVCCIGVSLLCWPKPAAAQGFLFQGDIVDGQCFYVTGNTPDGCDVEGFADITSATNSSIIDTFVTTQINDFTILDAGYFAVVDGSLIDALGGLNGGQGDSCFDPPDPSLGSDVASCAMDDYLVVASGRNYLADDDYLLIGHHSLDDGSGFPIDLGSSAVEAPIGAPAITGINPTYGFVGSSGIVTLQGTDLVDPFFGTVAVSASSGTGLTFTSASLSGDPFSTEFLDVGYTATQCASTGPRFIVVSTQFGSVNSDAQFTLGDPPPLITNVTPGAWQAGTSFTATINGLDFGTSPTLTISGTGVTFTVGNVSDTQITATVTVASSAPQQTVTITVQSNGYCGSGFQPAYPGEPSTSSYPVFVAPAAPTPQIQLYQQPITSTQSMFVGQQIALRAAVTLPAGVTISSQQWSTPTGAAIGGYTNASGNAPCLLTANCPIPDPNGGKVLALPNSTGDTSSSCANPNPDPATNTFYSCYTFYWVDSASARQISYSYQANTNGSSSATATFNVAAPTSPSLNAQPSTVNILPSALDPNTNTQTGPFQRFGFYPNPPSGITFTAAATLPTGNQGAYSFVQLIAKDVLKTIFPAPAGSQVCVPKGFFTNANPELDNFYPYPMPVGVTNSTNDSPGRGLAFPWGEEARSFSATMWLFWTPVADSRCPLGNICTTPAPLNCAAGSVCSVSWGYSADSINALMGQPTTWTKVAGVVVPPAGGTTPNGYPTYGYPTWTATFLNGSLATRYVNQNTGTPCGQ